MKRDHLAVLVGVASLLVAGIACSGGSYARAPIADYAVAPASGAPRTMLSAPSPGPAGAPAPRAQPDRGRKFVRNARIKLEVGDEGDYPNTLRRLAKLATDAKGYVSGETESSIAMMVPTAKLDAVIAQVGKLGEITERNVRIQDVTRQYVDLQVRIDNLRKMRERLKQLVAQSVAVEEILAIEKELQRVTTELERNEAQIRVMQRDTTYAAISVRLSEEVSPGPLGWIFYGTYVAVKWLFVWD